MSASFENPDFVREVFTYHPPTPEQMIQYEVIRRKAMELVEVIVKNSPRSADQSTAIRRVREAVMSANAAIALGGIV
jgi:hypothetical protein